MYSVFNVHVPTGTAVPGAVDFDLANMQVNRYCPISNGARYAIVPLEFAPNTLGNAQQTNCAATAPAGALLQPMSMPISLRYVPTQITPEHINAMNMHSRQAASGRFESTYSHGNRYSNFRGNGDHSAANRSGSSKHESDESNSNRRWATNGRYASHGGNVDEVDGSWVSSVTAGQMDREDISDYAYSSRRAEFCSLDANNNETSGFVEIDSGSSMVAPLLSAGCDKQQQQLALVSIGSDSQNADQGVFTSGSGRWDDLVTSDAQNPESRASPGDHEHRRESTPIGPTSGFSESETDAKREDLEGAIADVSAVTPDSPRSSDQETEIRTRPHPEITGIKQRCPRVSGANEAAEKPMIPSDNLQLNSTENRAWALNVHSAPWYPPNVRTAVPNDKQLLVAVPNVALRSDNDKENYAYAAHADCYGGAFDSFAADLKRGLPQSGPVPSHAHHAAYVSMSAPWGHAAPIPTRMASQPYSHARRSSMAPAQLVAMPVTSQAQAYACSQEGMPQAQPKRIRLSASGAAALQLNSIDPNRFAGIAPLAYGNESQAHPMSHSMSAAPAYSNRQTVTSGAAASGIGEDKVAANMKRLFTKIVETFDGLTADDAISIIRQVKIKRNGLKGLTMKTILSDAIEIVKEMNAQAGAVQQSSIVSLAQTSQPQLQDHSHLGVGSGAPTAWNTKAGHNGGERRGVISLARPAHEEPCLDVNCTDFLQYCKYKTELCAQQQAAGRCKMGAKCVYAHGPAELRPIRKLRMCNGMAKYGYCAYGDKCLWAHSEAELYHETLDDRLAWYNAGRAACLTIADVHRAPLMAPHPLGHAHVAVADGNTNAESDANWNAPPHGYNGRSRLSALQNIAPAPELAPRTWCAPRVSQSQDMVDGLANASPCLICGGSLRMRRPRTIECGHEFHDDCIRRWAFTQDLSCPICGRAIAGLSDAPTVVICPQPTNGIAAAR